MLFNSYGFLFAFLPLLLVAFHLSGKFLGQRAAQISIAIGSLFFYAWWNPPFLLLLLVSMLFNFSIGNRLSSAKQTKASKGLLIFGICANLLSIAYFKYLAFIVSIYFSLTSQTSPQLEVILPLAISFFTFQQIAYLVDSYRKEVAGSKLLDYCLFVCFFPQLIAGPIVHHKQVMPQFADKEKFRIRADQFAFGITYFFVGLAKKCLIADYIAGFSNPVFEAASQGYTLSFLEAWSGALCYSFQLYFDFSGYSDMAIGLGALFGIRLPINFNSPYKAANIIDFWRRWHITLSSFLRDYLYIPLGGNRCSVPRRYTNLLITMLLGGLWHGAGWTFVLWGGLHGIYLCINSAWQKFAPAALSAEGKGLAKLPNKIMAHALTLLAVVVAWVFFRAANFESATSILASMAGQNGFVLDTAIHANLNHLLGLGDWLHGAGIQVAELKHFHNPRIVLGILLLAFICLFAPNSQELMQYSQLKAKAGWSWKPSLKWAIATGLIAMLGIIRIYQNSEFLYFRF